ncbi:MAG: hypothetical protein ABR499_00785 [Gemmatimonadaceae bacterium]
MDNRQQRTVQTFERILVYLEQHPVEPEPPLLARMKQSLTTSIARLRELQRQQDAANIGVSGADVRKMRQRMRRGVLMPLVRIAKPLLRFAPGTAHVLRVPHARADTATIATHALDMAKALTPHAKLLTSAGYSTDFIVQFTKEARRLAAVTTDADKARQRRSRATAAIRQELEKAMGTVSVIEGILMARVPAGDREAMALWRGARRVQARAGRPRARGKRPTQSPPS